MKQHAASPSVQIRLRRAARRTGAWLLALAGLITGIALYGLLLLDQAQAVVIPVVNPDALPEIALDMEPTLPAAPDDTLFVHPDYPIARVEHKDRRIDNILVVGLDQNAPASILIMSCDKRRQTVRLIAVLASCRVKQRGRSQAEMLGSAFLYGGIGHLVNTCNETLGLDIQRFVLFDLTQLPALVDRLGGLPVTVGEEELAALQQSPDEAIRAIEKTIPAIDGPQRLAGRQVSAWMSLEEPFLDETHTPRPHRILADLTQRAGQSSLAVLQLLAEGIDAYATNLGRLEKARLAGQFLLYGFEDPVSAVPKEDLYTIQDDPWGLIVDWEKQKENLRAFIWGDVP